MSKNAIIDTSVLICLHHLGLLQDLTLLFKKVYVPRTVEKEFLKLHPKDRSKQTQRFNFLEPFYAKNAIWFKKCQAFNTEIIELYKTEKKLDDGEIEVFAQNQELGSNNILLLDETEARKVAEKNKLAKNGVLYILATFDLTLKNIDYYKSVERLRNEINTRFSNKIIEHVYKIKKKELSLIRY